MEVNTEIPGQALGQVSKAQLRRRVRYYMSIGGLCECRDQFGDNHRERGPELIGGHTLWTVLRWHGTNLGSLHLVNICVDNCWVVFCGAPGSETRTYLWCMVWLFGVYCVWWVALFSLGVELRNLILPQFDGLCFGDSNRRTIPQEWRQSRGVDRGWRVGMGQAVGGEKG